MEGTGASECAFRRTISVHIYSAPPLKFRLSAGGLAYRTVEVQFNFLSGGGGPSLAVRKRPPKSQFRRAVPHRNESFHERKSETREAPHRRSARLAI